VVLGEEGESEAHGREVDDALVPGLVVGAVRHDDVVSVGKELDEAPVDLVAGPGVLGVDDGVVSRGELAVEPEGSEGVEADARPGDEASSVGELGELAQDEVLVGWLEVLGAGEPDGLRDLGEVRQGAGDSTRWSSCGFDEVSVEGPAVPGGGLQARGEPAAPTVLVEEGLGARC
jgi:hypothetical protein